MSNHEGRNGHRFLYLRRETQYGEEEKGKETDLQVRTRQGKEPAPLILGPLLGIMHGHGSDVPTTVGLFEMWLEHAWGR